MPRYTVALPEGKDRWIDIEDSQCAGDPGMAVVTIASWLPNAELIASELCLRMNTEER